MVSVCTNCKSLQKHLRALDGEDHETHTGSSRWVSTTLPSLRSSTSRGCRACALLLQGILLHHDRFAGFNESDVKVSAESFTTSGQDHLSVDVRWATSDDDRMVDDHEEQQGYPNLRLEFFTDQDGQSPFSAIGRGRHISEHPLQDAGLSKARAMINGCLSTHSRCRHTKPTTLPKRVLDVLLDDGSKGVKLHEASFSRDEQRYEFGEYLALSYCWGSGSSVLKTTSKTLESFKDSIPWSALPRTFQDAVALTRALGFRWLWIDALCLIQDDSSEKLEESFRLDEIFQNSFLTIAATSAAESTDGLFLAKSQPFKIQATDSKGSVSRIYVREQPSHYSFKAPFDEGSHMNDWELPFNPSIEANLQTPLLRRAWAYAERLLSPRVLHFTKSEMILECREGYQCECGRIDDVTFDSRTTDCVKQEFARIVAESEALKEMMNGHNHHRADRADSLTSQLAATSLIDSKALAARREEALQLWSYIVTEYTSRELTYDVDRLLAIVGVAKALSHSLQSGYIAGQWTSSTLGLLWYASESTRCRRPKGSSNNIPSWSWGAVEGSPILFENSIAMDLACSSSFSSEKGGKFAWLPTSGDSLELTAAMATDVTFRVDGTNEYSLVKNGVSAEFTPDVSPSQGYDAISDGETLICVLVCMSFRSSIIGLVLQPSRSDPHVYRRVGRFECYDCQKDGTDEEPQDAEALFGHWFPEIEDFSQLDNGPQRSFTVV